jgi:hypothetical protein
MKMDWTDRQLETAFTEIRSDVLYPPTPPLAARVQRQLASQPVAHLSRWPGFPRVWYAIAALVLVTILSGVLWPEAREVVAERLGLRGVRITYVPTLEPRPQSMDPRPCLGPAVDLGAARSQVQFPILVPTVDGLSVPDEVYLKPSGRDGEISLVYHPRPGFPEAPGTGVGLLVSQTPGRDVGPSYAKGAGPGTRVQSVRVAGKTGFWIDGEPHQLFSYLGPSGDGRMSQPRLAANVLVWEQDGLTLRLEGAFSLDTALRIAMSMR